MISFSDILVGVFLVIDKTIIYYTKPIYFSSGISSFTKDFHDIGALQCHMYIGHDILLLISQKSSNFPSQSLSPFLKH